MDSEKAAAVFDAILSQGSKAYNTPSGAVLTVLSDLAVQGDLRSLSSAFVIFARAKPANARFVEESIPPKILNQYLHGWRGVTFDEFERWGATNTDWPRRLKDALRDPELFEQVVEKMAGEMRPN